MDYINSALIEPILNHYYLSFSQKTYSEDNNDSDFLMDLYNISPELKRENRQYWGRELGMLWQLLVTEIVKNQCPTLYRPALRFDKDEPCDLILGNDAIDTKYRIGSGDSGTLKKFKSYGHLLQDQGLRPVILLVREDNLPAAIKACQNGGWTIFSGEEAKNYLKEKTNVDIELSLKQFGDKYHIR